jgi:purine-binding chemotaxis protein CheW
MTAVDTQLQLVVFHLGDECYGLEISDVREIIAVPRITPIPRAPAFIEGVINLRGRVVPIVDLRGCLGLPSAERTRATRVIVAAVGDYTLGMVADAVSQVLTVDRTDIEPPNPTVSDARTAYVRGIAKVDGRMVIWADLTRLLFEQQRGESGLLAEQLVG